MATEPELVITTTRKLYAATGQKCLIYGAAGSGKTNFGGTAPNPFIISAEGGMMTLRNKDIPVTEVSTIADVEKALEWCRTKAAGYGIQSIVLDSISEIAEKCLSNEKAKTRDPRAAFGEMATHIIDLVKDFRDLYGFHVIVIAKQRVGKDPVTGVEKAGPTAPGQQIGPALPYLFDFVFHAYTDKDPTTGDTYHAIRTKAAFNAEAKDRSGVLDEVEYPDFTHLLTKIGNHDAQYNA